MTGTRTQNELIRDHLEQGKRITPVDALNFFQCMRLASRICELRRDGLPVQSRVKTLKNGKKVAEYFLLNQNLKKLTTCHDQ